MLPNDDTPGQIPSGPPAPFELWQQAETEVGDEGEDAVVARYHQLLETNGYEVPGGG